MWWGSSWSCGAPALAQTTATSLDRDAQEVKSYRLSLSVLEKLGAIHKAAAAARMKDPRHQQLAGKKAELATLEAKQEPTDAEQERMDVLAEEIERLEQGDDEDAALGDARSLSEMAAKIDAQPALAAAVRGAGMTTREFATAELALLQAGLAYGLQKAGRPQAATGRGLQGERGVRSAARAGDRGAARRAGEGRGRPLSAVPAIRRAGRRASRGRRPAAARSG